MNRTFQDCQKKVKKKGARPSQEKDGSVMPTDLQESQGKNRRDLSAICYCSGTLKETPARGDETQATKAL